MKNKTKYAAFISLLLLTFAPLCLQSAETWPNMPLRTNTVVLCWDPSPPEENVDYYRIYIRHSFPPEMPLTNSGSINSLLSETWTGECGTNVMRWTPAESATNGWTLLVTLTNKAPSGELLNIDHTTLTNTWSGSNLPAFFVLTAKNVTGESPFSNVAWVPRPIQPTNSFRILSAE